MVKKAKEDYTHAPLHDLSGPRDLENISRRARVSGGRSHVDDEMADRVAGVKDYVQDAGNIYGDVSHTDQLTYSRELLGMIRRLKRRATPRGGAATPQTTNPTWAF